MADLPILFSGPMVQALLREIEQPGTGKTQTRRIWTPPKAHTWADEAAGLLIYAGNGLTYAVNELRCRYSVDDRLYVREAWRTSGSLDRIRPRDLPTSSAILFEANDAPAPVWRGKKRPGMFLPRWASRLTLIVTDVRVQRLLDISDADAIAEGVGSGYGGGPAIEDFICLWNSIHGAFASDRNPWVAAYTFRPILGNIDQARP